MTGAFLGYVVGATLITFLLMMLVGWIIGKLRADDRRPLAIVVPTTWMVALVIAGTGNADGQGFAVGLANVFMPYTVAIVIAAPIFWFVAGRKKDEQAQCYHPEISMVAHLGQ